MLKNWAQSFEYGAQRVHLPTSVEQVQELVAGARKVKASGTRHSFSKVADTEGDLISLQNFNKLISIDLSQMTATLEGGMSYGDLCSALSRFDLAVHNLASLPHISVVGACSTATHGSGDRNGNLSTAVSGLEIVKADGNLVWLSRGDQGFDGAVVNLGALGVITKVTLDVLPAFQVRQNVYERLLFKRLLEDFDEITSSAYSVSLFTHWRNPVSIEQVWLKDKDDAPPFESFYGAAPATKKLHPIRDINPIHCTEQMGVYGPSFERLPHFRMDYVPSSGDELQSEYLIPRKHAVDALQAIHSLSEKIWPLLQISEIRTMATDSLWMSPSYGQNCIGVHFTWKKKPEHVHALLPIIEEKLAPFQARPHWAKLFHSISRDLYERLGDFQGLVGAFDPEGKFRNEFLETHVL